MSNISKKVCDLCHSSTVEAYSYGNGWATVNVVVEPLKKANEIFQREKVELDICPTCWTEKPRRILDDVLDKARNESREKLLKEEEEYKEESRKFFAKQAAEERLGRNG